MEKLVCPHCGSALGKGIAVCGECGKEVTEAKQAETAASPDEKDGRKNIYAILAVFLAVVGGAALMIYTGLLPNPVKGGGSTAAIVNGEKISAEEVDRKLEVFKKRLGKKRKLDASSPEGTAALADMRRQIVQTLVKEKILVTEAAREKITVPPKEVADRIAAIKQGVKLSDKDFEAFLKNHAMSVAAFEKRIEKELLISKLLEKGAQKGLTKDAWISELTARAKVEIIDK